MATYVALIRFTEQGARNIRDTQKRAAAFREAAQKAGVTVREIYWLMGAYDGLIVMDAPDEATVTTVMADLGTLGNVRTQTMRAFDESEIGGVLGRAGGGGGMTAARGGGGGAGGGGGGGGATGAGGATGGARGKRGR